MYVDVYEDIQDLIELIVEGEILAICPGCKIPLTYKEIEETKCSCGAEFDLVDMTFISIENIPEA